VAGRSSKRSKADSALVEREGSVDVLHEAVTEQPDVVTKTEVLASDSTNALAVADRTEVEVGSTDRPGLATPAEADSGGRTARVRIVTFARVVHLRAGDLGEERLDGAGRAVNDGGAGVDDRLEVRDSCGRAHDCLAPGSLPEASRLVDGMVLD
jgi:hypothetical protein